MTPLGRVAVASEAIVTPRPLAAKAIAELEVIERTSFLDDAGSLADAFAELRGPETQKKLLPPHLQRAPMPEKGRGRLLVADAGDGLRAFAELYADQQIREEELPDLARARARLEKVLAMRPAIGMLAPPVQKRLREQLFEPLEELVEAAAKHEVMVRGAVEARDIETLKRVTAQGGAAEYRTLDVAAIRKRSELNGAERYQLGDPIRVVLDDGSAVLGFVTVRKPDGGLIAEWLDAADHLHAVSLSRERIARENPLKIGDSFAGWGRNYWVTGIDSQGELRVIDEQHRRYDAFDVQNKLLPLERLEAASKDEGMFAGDATSDAIYFNRGRAGEVALHTHRGFGYKDWNEDAGCAFVDGGGRLFVGVFDQAGGEGSDPNARGAASAIAGRAFFEEMRDVARKRGGVEDASDALGRAVQRAHGEVSGRGRGEVSTFIGAVIDGEHAVILNLGDSGAMWFDSRGEPLARTVDQGIGAAIFDGIGFPHREGTSPKPDEYRWRVSPGQYLVLGSDGLLDAGLTEEQIGWVVARAKSAEAATRALRDLVVERMKTGQGKKDNLTISVVRIGG